MHARSKIEKMAQGNSQSAPHGRIRGGGGGGGGGETFSAPTGLSSLAELNRPWGREKPLTRWLKNWSGTAKVDVSHIS